MRGIIVTLVILFGTGYLATTFEGGRTGLRAQSSSEDVAEQWRRTRNGWESRASWPPDPPTPNPSPIAWRLHPALIALLQLLISILALAWSETDPRFVIPRREM